MLHGNGQFYYASDEGGRDWKADKIATSGFFYCSTLGAKLAQEGATMPLRLSEKPVTLAQYFVTSYVR